MHPEVRQQFSRIVSRLPPPLRVIEIGQDKDHPSLIDLPELASAKQRVAVGLSAGGSVPGVSYLPLNANDLSSLQTGHFDLTLSNAMLEHDAQFWLTLSEIRRITRPGGYLVIGVPSYGAMAGRSRGWQARLLSWITGQNTEQLAAATATLGLHAFPDDYYRFSRSAMEKVILAGCSDKHVIEMLWPTRVIGVGKREEEGNTCQ